MMRYCLLVLLLLLSLLLGKLYAGDAPKRLKSQPAHARVNEHTILPTTKQPGAQIQEVHPNATIRSSPKAQTSTQQHSTVRRRVESKRPIFERLGQLFQSPSVMKRAKRVHRRNFLAGLLGFLGLCAGLIGNWYGILLLFVPNNASAIVVSGLILGLVFLGGYLGIKSVDMADNPWGIAAIVSAVVSVVLLITFLILVL